jgi:SagB-type dehydrogenase family enzyme
VNERFTLRAEVRFAAENGNVRLETPRLAISLTDPAGLVAAALGALARGAAWDAVLDLGDSAETIAALDFSLRRMRRLGLLERTLETAEGPLATLVPTAHGGLEARRTALRRGERSGDPGQGACGRRLSRFAHLRRVDGELGLETPLAPYRVVLHDWRGPALLADPPPGLVEAEALEAFLEMLEEAGMLDEDPPMWEFHDLVFHAGSRLGRHDRPYGGTYRFEGGAPSPPAVRPKFPAPAIPLPRPDLGAIADPPLARVMEERRSIRTQGAVPPTLGQLSEFLYRTFRTDEIRFDGHQEIARRPHANAGALYELELYLIVDRCGGLEPGAYHYDSHAHALEPLATAPADRAAMLDFVRRGCGMSAPPQILITLTSRIGRLAWKYAGIAYASTLKDVGIVYQSMYLAATAMGLAPCALGGGDGDLFARALGIDYYEEPAVGEFMLGSAP